MNAKYKEFGSVTVMVQELCPLMRQEAKVMVNWSCRGMVPIPTAEQVVREFKKAITYARKHAKRLGV